MIFFWNKNSTKNRRKKERVSFHVPVKILVPSLASIRGEAYVEVHGKNISEGGILVEAKRSYPRLVPCRIKIDGPGESQGAVLDGMIIWADENSKVGNWEVGIAFINLREEERMFLHQIVLQSQ